MIDISALRNKLTNGHDLSIEECEYLKSLLPEPVTTSAGPSLHLHVWSNGMCLRCGCVDPLLTTPTCT